MILRAAFRSLSRSRLFVVVAILALGAGLGLSTTMFAVLDAVANPYRPYAEPDQLFTARWYGNPRFGGTMTRQEFYEVIRELPAFEAVTPFVRGEALLEGRAPRQVQTASVTPAFFALMGRGPDRGRAFTAADGDGVALLTDALWRAHTGSKAWEPGVSIVLGDRSYTVIGVLPRGFTFPSTGVLLPLAPDADQGARAASLTPLVRVRSGVSREAVDAEMRTFAAFLTDRYRAHSAPYAVHIYPIREQIEEISEVHFAMVGAALAVLLIACVNLAHLMLARGMARRREFALHLALGARRSAVVRQMFAECAIITLGGAAVGGLLALWGGWILAHKMPPEVRFIGLIQPQLSWRVFAMAALAAAAAAIVFGLIPAIRVALAVDLTEPLKELGAGSTARRRRRYSTLVVSEIALAMVLLMGGSLLLRSVSVLSQDWWGYDPDRVLLAIMIPQRGTTENPPPVIDRAQLQEILRGVPGVERVASQRTRTPAGRLVSAESDSDSSRTLTVPAYYIVGSDFFAVKGLPILAGRGFLPGDELGEPIAVLDAVAAARLYPNQDPVGRMIKLGAPASSAEWVRVVGVARATVPPSRSLVPIPELWVVETGSAGNTLLLRTASADPRVPYEVRQRLLATPGIRDALVDRINANEKAARAVTLFLARVFVTMGAVGLALAALGLYGVLAYSVNQRMREFAVRLALGARPGQIQRMVLHDGAVMLLAGTGIGAFIAIPAGSLVASMMMLYHVDVWSLVAAEAVLLLTGLLAALAPARRAMRADPMSILRAV